MPERKRTRAVSLAACGARDVGRADFTVEETRKYNPQAHVDGRQDSIKLYTPSSPSPPPPPPPIDTASATITSPVRRGRRSSFPAAGMPRNTRFRVSGATSSAHLRASTRHGGCSNLLSVSLTVQLLWRPHGKEFLYGADCPSTFWSLLSSAGQPELWDASSFSKRRSKAWSVLPTGRYPPCPLLPM